MAAKQPIVVVGGGGHGKVVLNILLRLSQFQVLGYIDPRDNGPVLGVPRLGGDDALPALASKPGIAAAIGVGKLKAGGPRTKILSTLRELGFALPVIVAPTAAVSFDAVLGEASVVMDGAVVQPGCVVGRAAILNTNSSLDHDCTLGEDVHIAPAAALSGNASVGDGCMVGIGSCVKQGVRIFSGCTIGAGAAVVRDC
ncbi:MAG: NeuD/PglB/VioB family sugar acetyltransferase, partial [Bdellovibrionota bacterium]